MIEDNELRNLFQVETEERIKSLEAELRKLETNAQDKEAIESALRDAHTIKGSARMLNIQSIETIAHQIENHLTAIKNETLVLSPKIIHVIYESLYAIEALAKEAITGKPANVNISAILKALSDEITKIKKPATSMPKSVSGSALKEQNEQLSSQAVSPALPSTRKKGLVSDQKEQKEDKELKKRGKFRPISTVRVDMQYISSLVSQAADLTVTKTRIARLFERIEEILDMWEKEYRTYQYYSLVSHEQGKEQRDAAIHAMINACKEIGESLRHLRSEAYEDIHQLELIVSSLVDQIRRLSLLPLSKLFDLFPRMVHDLSQAAGKEVELRIEGGEITVDKKIIEDMKDPLMHLLRNAISHGIEPAEERAQKGKPIKGLIQLIGKQTPMSIVIEVLDDGQGLDTEKIKTVAIQRQIISEKEAKALTSSEIHALIFLPGFSTATQISDISGRGVGMNVVKNQIEKLNGTLDIHSTPGQGCSFFIQLPISYLTTQVILAQVDKRIYALPIEMIEECLLLSPNQIVNIEGHPLILLQNQPVSLIFLRHLIEASHNSSANKEIQTQSCIIVKAQNKRVALVVDAILDEQKVGVIPPNRFLLNTKSIIGTTILRTGEACVILNPFELVKSALQNIQSLPLQFKNKKAILLVEDSYSTRVLLARALEKFGYHVIVAENGMEGWNKLMENIIDAVVTDVKMPKMDGFTLISNIRNKPSYSHLPIIVLTTLSSLEDKKRGMEMGADVYLIKSDPDYQAQLLQTLNNLLY